MPNITEYNSPQALQGIRPNELGADALAQSGRRIESVYHQAGEELGGGLANLGQAGEQAYKKIQQHDAMQEISTGAAALANITSQLTNQWNQTANQSDLNDHTIADNFRQNTLEPALEKWQQGFTTEAGQKWALERADALRSHMFEKTSADMLNRQSDALVANYQTTLNAASNLARNDPTSMPHAMDLLESSIRAGVAASGASATAGSKMLTEGLAKGKEQIAMAAGMGMAERNPAALQAEIDKGTFNDLLGPEKIRQLQGFASASANAADRQAERVSQDQKNQYLAGLVDPETSTPKQFTTQQYAQMVGSVLTNPRMREQEKTQTVEFLKNWQKAQSEPPKIESDPQLMGSFRARFRSGDPAQYPTSQEIGRALGTQQITPADAHTLEYARTLLDPKQTKDPVETKRVDEVLKDIHGQITGGAPPGSYSAAEGAAVDRFDAWFWDVYPRARANSMSYQALLSPDSPQYMLKPDVLNAFKISGSDIVAPPTNKLPSGPRPPLSQFFGPKPAPKSVPMTDQEIFDSPKGGA